MSTYKITNITHLLGKREHKYNSNLDIEYVDSMNKKTIVLKPNESVFLSIVSLPLSVHRLRVKNLIIVTETGQSTPNDAVKKVEKPVVNKTETKKEEVEKKFEKKKLDKKEHTE
jgi:hypothetical protein